MAVINWDTTQINGITHMSQDFQSGNCLIISRSSQISLLKSTTCSPLHPQGQKQKTPVCWHSRFFCFEAKISQSGRYEKGLNRHTLFQPAIDERLVRRSLLCQFDITLALLTVQRHQHHTFAIFSALIQISM